MASSNNKPFAVYTVRESPKKGERDFWTRIGSAFPHQGGDGFNVRLDALPMDGKLVILPPKEDTTSKDGSASQSSHEPTP